MVTKNIKTVITKWEQTGDGYNNTAKDGEDLGFMVGRYFGGDRSCAITADIQITTEDTTFILDVKIESIIAFANATTPTSENIYDLYKEARLKWRNEILKRCQSESLPLTGRRKFESNWKISWRKER